MSIPTPETATPYPGAPRFFRRVWDPGPPGVVQQGAIAVVTPTVPDGGLAIYGYAAQSRYAEDHAMERAAWERDRAFMAWCFSHLCPEGEPGMVPLGEVEEISEAEFRLAEARGWQ